MAQLNSPGVSVTVVDESFYTPAAPGTVPLIIVASQANKMNSAGTGIAPGTLEANAGTVYLLTSQQDLGSTFGVPYFQTDAENNPVNAGEVNEYGLQAAYSFLGVSNQAYVVRADLDLSQLEGSGIIPTGAPADGTYWWDTAATQFGVFQWNASPATATNGQSFIEQQSISNLTVITSSAYLNTGEGFDGTDGYYSPLASYGSPGDYAVVATTTLAVLWFKTYNTASDGSANNSAWVQVGSSAWTGSWPVATGTSNSVTLLTSDTFVINGYTVTGVTTLSALVSAIGNHATGVTATIQNGYLNLYSNGTTSGSGSAVAGAVTISGSAVAKCGLTVGTYFPPTLTISPHYSVPTYSQAQNFSTSVNGYPTGSLWIKTTPVNLGASFDIQLYNAASASWLRQTVSQLWANNTQAIYALDPTGGGINIPAGQVYVKYNDDETSPAYANFKIYQRTLAGTVATTSSAITASTFSASTYTFQITASQTGSASLPSLVTVSFTATAATTDANVIVAAINNQTASLNNIVASVNALNEITITHITGGEIKITDGTGTPISKLFSQSSSTNFFNDPSGTSNLYVITGWAAANSSGTALVTPSATAPTTVPANGTLWYDSSISDVDILINDGTHWRGFLTTQGKAINNPTSTWGTTDPNGPIVSATAPVKNSVGGTLANGDIWVDSSDLENWPSLHKWNIVSQKWVLINNADHTSNQGIIFADARWVDNSLNITTPSSPSSAGTPGTIVSLLSSSYVDGDAPNAQLYPAGTLLYNTRRSSFNVKKYVSGYVNTSNYNFNQGTPGVGVLQTYYYLDAWVSQAPNNYQGVGQFGRKAQRAVVVTALNALIESNQQIRDEDSRVFDIISCPGYLETLPALVDLNNDRGLLSFIVADAPARLTPDATSLSNWGNNTANATGDGEQGLITTDSNTAVYYPWGYTTDLNGNNIVVPPSHIMLRTIALSDNVSYPWFAPAGVRRGGVTNASSVGYVDAQTGEFVPTALNTGQRDTLASIHVNPITYIGGTGLVVYGQYTRQLVASALDRINVARLVIYLRYQLNAIAKPYIFEPNDTITRNEIKQEIEKLMLNLTGERALYDYLVVCDTSNNTPSRIDASELYVDIAIEPVKAVEFIYIPLRLENTGAIKGLSGA